MKSGLYGSWMLLIMEIWEIRQLLMQQKILSDMLPDIQIIEAQKSKLVANLSELKKAIKPTDLIVLQGSGNMGNLYPRYEWMRLLVVRNFPNVKIIVFPQSIYFTDDKYGLREQRVSAKVYRNHKKLTIFTRDSKSQKKYVKCFLVQIFA